MDEHEAVSAQHAAIHLLEAALKANGIGVPQGAVQTLIDQREWIYRSKRVDDLLKKLSNQQLYSVFNYQHHLHSSAKLFEFIKDQGSCVVYGYKAQGKTQFLFFVFKLLQAMGEKVLFLDRTILPLEDDNMVDLLSDRFCGHLWKESFDMETVQSCLDQFYKDALPDSFGKFTKALREYTRSSKTRIWIIVDEVVLFENFPIRLPEEQDLGPFNWIITGSAGICTWVAKRHLENLVFDLPLFRKDECLTFVAHLSSMLKINLENTIGVPAACIDDWLEERFGGVVGYIAELILEISNGTLVSKYLSSLDDRINKIFSHAAKGRNLSEVELSSVWLKDIKSGSNNWNHLRDAGLCGSHCPRGIIFSFILQCLHKYSLGENALALVSNFRKMFSTDPGLDGCLLELEEILKLKANGSIKASLLSLTDQGWSHQKSVELPPKGQSCNVLVYIEDHSILTSFYETSKSKCSSWHLIELPSGFDVIDVVLVDNTDGSLAIYGIQITRSLKPFSKHHTFDTCPLRSEERLKKLWRVISDHFKLDVTTVKKFYVMLATNCEEGEFKPPVRHSSDYYFSPTSVMTSYNPFKHENK